MDRVFTIEQLRPIKNGMTLSRDAKMGTTIGITFFSLGKDTSSARNAMNNIIKVEFETAFAAMLSVPTEKQGECIRFLRSYYRLPVKCHCIKLGYFG